MNNQPALKHWPCFILILILGLAGPVFAQSGTPETAEAIDGFTNTPMLPDGQWHVHDPNRPQPRVVTPGATFSQNAPAPSDAEVLFDGTDLSKWETEGGEPAIW